MRPLRRTVIPLLVTAVAAAGVAAGGPATAATGSSAATFAVPPSGVFTVQGHGWGHGHGMSQYGAYGAAKVRGLSYQQILAFYYPHTTLTGQPMSTQVRVLVHGVAARQLAVAPRPATSGPAAPLTVSTDASGLPPCTLPSTLDGTTPVQQWRAKVVDTSSGARVRLQASTDGSTWHRAVAPGCDPGWRQPIDGSVTFDNGGITRLVRSTGSTADYRGSLRAAFTGSRIYGVNVVRLEAYLRSVVPSEMPSSWSPAALQAQAVAARTYASYEIAHPKNRAYYDVYDDTRDQMYVGVGGEAPSSDAAIAATQDRKTRTAGVLVDEQGHPAFTQFSSSDGGWTVDGGQPYLPAQKDPYDGLVPSSVHTWTAKLSAAAINAQFRGQIGTLQSLAITGRDGNGAWGGRVTELTLNGSAGSVTITGATFRYYLGLRSEWFRVLVPPAAPTDVTATRTDSSVAVAWQPPPVTGSAPVRGYRLVLQRTDGSVADVAQKVGADARTATFSGVPAGGDYTVSVAATSVAGRGPAATVTTKVDRVLGGNRVATAIAMSRATFAADAAGSVLLARRGGWAQTLAAAPLAAVRHAPVLLTTHSHLPGATEREIQRVLPAGGRVVLLGDTGEISDGVRTQLRGLGYHVQRIGGATPAATARSIANAVLAVSRVTAAVEVSATDPGSAWVAGPAAARRHAVVLLTNGSQPARESQRWLSRHPQVSKRFAVGAAAAADPGARAITGATSSDVAVAVANRFFPTPVAAAIVAPAASVTGAVAAARAALARAPVLVAAGDQLASSVQAYLRGARVSVQRVDLVGEGLPYDDVESDTQAALLP
ncbi:MAG TPA: SpoIID/LytB domain-containing protein [Mycobacteriales bacterium]|nr:SpoIID/LytB domain-containing protein [Mycobacteriales bacterium]